MIRDAWCVSLWGSQPPSRPSKKHASTTEENRCIDAAPRLIKKRRDAGTVIRAIIVEPISEVENRLATSIYYKKLR